MRPCPMQAAAPAYQQTKNTLCSMQGEQTSIPIFNDSKQQTVNLKCSKASVLQDPCCACSLQTCRAGRAKLNLCWAVQASGNQ
eukprot:1160397-Pelagomonas_calceolata.AAC.2